MAEYRTETHLTVDTSPAFKRRDPVQAGSSVSKPRTAIGLAITARPTRVWVTATDLEGQRGLCQVTVAGSHRPVCWLSSSANQTMDTPSQSFSILNLTVQQILYVVPRDLMLNEKSEFYSDSRLVCVPYDSKKKASVCFSKQRSLTGLFNRNTLYYLRERNWILNIFYVNKHNG